MGQTAMQKILAAHAGKKTVEPGEFILAKADLAMANDITAPIAIKALEKNGITKLWNKDRIAIVFSHFVPAKDILSAAQAAVAVSRTMMCMRMPKRRVRPTLAAAARACSIFCATWAGGSPQVR